MLAFRALIRGVALLIAAGAAVLSAGQGQPPRFSAQSDAVAVPVLVKSGGRPVADLTIADFAISDSGVPQTITAVQGVDAPLDVSVVLQQTRFVEWLRTDTFASELDDVRRLLRSSDRLEVVSASNGSQVLLPLGPPDRTISLPVEPWTPCVTIYDAMVRVLARPPVSGRRHLLLVLTGGEGAGGAITRDSALAVAERSHTAVSVFVTPPSIGRTVWVPWGQRPLCSSAGLGWNDQTKSTLSGISRTLDVHDQDRAFAVLQRERLDLFAERTGGRRLNPPLIGRSIVGLLRPVLDEARTKYTLYYTPVGVASTGWHPIAVTIRREGRFDVNARSGYDRR